MSQQVLREEKPGCFGRIDEPAKNSEGWNPSCPACAGGIDAAFVDEKTGSHIRERCMFFAACGTIAQAKKMEAMRSTLIDPRTLTRQQQVPTVQGPLSSYQQQNQNNLAASIQQQQAAALQQQQYAAMQQQMAQMQRMNPQVPIPGMMPMGFQQMMPVNYNMPGYLSNPEPVHTGGFWRSLGLTVFRSVGKSVGHSVSFMFDSVPLGGPKPPGT